MISVHAYYGSFFVGFYRCPLFKNRPAIVSDPLETTMYINVSNGIKRHINLATFHKNFKGRKLFEEFSGI